MNEITIDSIYSLVSANTNVLVQNTGKQVIELFVTDGVAPLNEPGLQLQPSMAINRSDIPSVGSLYARTQKNVTSSLLVSE